MPEIPDVVAMEEIFDEWGNAIRDRTVQRYDDLSTRATKAPSPNDGDLSFLEDSGELHYFFNGLWRGFVPAGSVMPFAGSSAPPGWLVCNGAVISRTEYASLFAAIGPAFGAGDGSTTFAIPDLRGRFPLGVASSGTGSTRGDTGGSIDHTHTGPSHTHTMGTHTHTGPSHTHTGPSHTHSNPAHNHLMLAHSHAASTGGPSSTIKTALGASGSTVGSATHTHTVTVSPTYSQTDGGGNTTSGSSGTGATGASGTGNTGATDPGDTNASGTGATGAANPPFVALNYIIRY